ncbi:MAG: tRNA (adenosine(37)-N6)-dimethylallyltransferase MiaA [bacterium]
MNPTLPVIFLTGPTATGKTDLAATLSDIFPLELVSVDAAQVYVGMDIGTAKPSDDFLARYPHHLINIRAPEDTYSAADFVRDALQLISEIHERGNIPVLVGGTMFYFKALEHGLSSLPSASSAVRKEINHDLNQLGVHALHHQLHKIDPIIAERIDKNDIQRVQRALEIFKVSGKPPSELMVQRSGLLQKPIKLTIFSPDRGQLHDRIAQRFLEMLEQGLVQEVSSLRERPGFSLTLPSMRTVGYRQVLEYLAGDVTYEQLVERGTSATRQLAKRQLTWMRQQSGLVWFEAGGAHQSDAVVQYLRQRIS